MWGEVVEVQDPSNQATNAGDHVTGMKGTENLDFNNVPVGGTTVTYTNQPPPNQAHVYILDDSERAASLAEVDGDRVRGLQGAEGLDLDNVKIGGTTVSNHEVKNE